MYPTNMHEETYSAATKAAKRLVINVNLTSIVVAEAERTEESYASFDRTEMDVVLFLLSGRRYAGGGLVYIGSVFASGTCV